MIRRVAIGVVLGMTLFGGSALAAGSDAAVEDAAKARYTEGVKLYNKKKYEEARAAFMQAIALKKKPSAMMMLGESALKSGRWLEAMRSFEEFEKIAVEMPPKLKDLVEAGQKREARAHLGRIAFDVPEGAEVTVDGEKLAEIKTIDVAVGTHSIVVTHREEKKSIEIETQPGKTAEVHPSFVPKAIIPTDTRTRPTPAATAPPSLAGTANEQESPSILSPPATKWPIYVMGGVGLTGLATAAIFGGLAANARHGVEVAQQTISRNATAGADCSNPDSFTDKAKGQSIEEFQSTCDSLARQQHFATIHQSVFQTSLIVGLAGLAGAVTWFLVAPKEGAKSDDATKGSTLVIPWAGPGGGGLSATGRF